MNNIEKIQQMIKNGSLDAVMLTSPANRLYASGFASSDGIVFITADSAYFITDSRYSEAAEIKIGNAAKVLVTRIGKGYNDYLNGFIAKHSVHRLGFEERELSYHEYCAYKERLSAELIPGQIIPDTLRTVKSEQELEIMIKAQRIAEAGFDDLLGVITPEMTEKQVAAELVYRMALHGSDDVSFRPIVVSGERSSMPHGVATDAVISGFLTMDFGVKYGGYCSDMTRTISIGKPTAEMEKVYYTVLEAQETAIAGTKAGITGRELDAIARNVITKAGYGEYFGHSYGHGLGIDVHEKPYAGPGSENIIPAGAVVSAEPGIYLPGKFGVRIEDCVYITDGGSINLMKTAKKLVIL